MPGDYFGDLVYDVWMRGGNPDLVDRDRAEEYRQDGLESWDAAGVEMRRQRPQRTEDDDAGE